MSVTAILQARVSSSRLPGKVLLPILGQPMLMHQLNRTLAVNNIDTLVVATSEESSDEPIAKLCAEMNIPCFRGSLDDVLDRFYRASQHYPSTHVVRMTGDCPVIDPFVVDDVITKHIASGADYTTNAIPASFPDGLDVEVMTQEALKEAWEKAMLPSEREHVTPYIRENSQFENSHIINDKDLSDYRWTVDEAIDFELIRFIYEELHEKNPLFTYQDILDLLEVRLDAPKNKHIQRNEGYAKSLREDQNIY